MTVVSSERLADVFVEFADTLIDDYDVIEFLLMVTNRTAELVGASDVGLLLADQRGRGDGVIGGDSVWHGAPNAAGATSVDQYDDGTPARVDARV